MRLLLIASLLSMILLAGCFGPATPPPPEYKPPAVRNLTPAAEPVNNTSSKTFVPAAPKKNATSNTTAKTNATAPKTNTSKVNTTSKTNATASKTNVTAQKTNITVANTSAPVALPCNGLSTSAALDCLAKLAIEKKDVLICTQLTAKEDRLKCFAQWCASGARDYRQCSKLVNVDDRLGCTMKCNPNFNT